MPVLLTIFLPMTTDLPASIDDHDPARDRLLRLLADLNAQSRDARGVSLSLVIDGKGNAYFQSSTDLDAADQPQLPTP